MIKPGSLCKFKGLTYKNVSCYTYSSLEKAGYFGDEHTDVIRWVEIPIHKIFLIIKFLPSIEYSSGFYQALIDDKILCVCSNYCEQL